MSKSKHDQRRRPRSGKRCPESQNGGCAYCGTGDQKKHLNRSRRAASKRIARRGLEDSQ